MKVHNDYYVYTYGIPPADYYDSEKIIYVGMGRGKRAFMHIPTDMDAVTVRIVDRDMTRSEALALEAEMIAQNLPHLRNKQSAKVRYRLTNAEGKEFDVVNLAHFCRQHKLNYDYMQDVLSGNKPQYKGWTGIRYPHIPLSV